MPVERKPLFRPDVVWPRALALPFADGIAGAQVIARRWANLLASPHGQTGTESELLPEYLGEVFGGILGYRGPSAEGSYFTLSREKRVEVNGEFADAALGRFGPATARIVAAVEGKGPRDPLDRPFGGRAISAVDQAYRYAINLECDWVVITNLREIRLYHKGHDQRTFERFEISTLAEQETHLRRFVFLLGAERVVPDAGSGHLTALLEESERTGVSLTHSYYGEYSAIRREFLGKLTESNPQILPEILLLHTQKLLDRVLFIAFAEDRGLLPSATLRRAFEHVDPYNPRSRWETFKGLFRAIDEGNAGLGIPGYNGGLFRKDGGLDQLVIPDGVFELVRRLGEYDYRSPVQVEDEPPGSRVVDVEILGHIFEQSITDIESIERELAAGGLQPDRVSRRKRQGAFYTPQSITRFIVERALRPVLDARFDGLRRRLQEPEKRPTAARALAEPRVYDLEKLNNQQRDALSWFWKSWLEELETVYVLDPACGSGAFLFEAFDQLHAVYQEAAGRLAELQGQRTVFEPDRTILERNLFGVDLNEEAVQIARLSIWIKTAQVGKRLTDLDSTVRAGNSLVESVEVDPRHALDWRAAFPHVFAAGGFDVVVGNPPYVRQELLGAVKPYLSERYRSYHGVADLYVYFFERGLELLRPGGRLSFVVTNKWLKAGYAEPLRRLLSENSWVETIVDLGHAKQVFPDADVFPSTSPRRI